MKLELLLIVNDTELYHRSVSTLDDSVNPYTGAINAMINELTKVPYVSSPRFEIKSDTKFQVKSDKFTKAVPDYMPPVEEQLQFHPDLVKQGIAPAKPAPMANKEIPLIKLDMKTVFKDKK